MQRLFKQRCMILFIFRREMHPGHKVLMRKYYSVGYNRVLLFFSVLSQIYLSKYTRKNTTVLIDNLQDILQYIYDKTDFKKK